MTLDAWSCGCGQRYRVEVLADGIRFWPRMSSERISVDAYCRRGLPAGAHCIGCEAPLVLSGTVGVSDADAPLTRDLYSRLSVR
jgi:hypothetical protein